MLPPDLPERWRARAAELDRYAAPAAEAFRAAAAELDEALADAEGEELTLAQAVAESGYSERALRGKIASGEIENAGRKHAPRIRRADLPRKAKARAVSTYDVAADARKLLARMR